MTKEEALMKIIELRPYVDALWSNTTIKMSIDDQNKLRDIYKFILPGQRLNMACMDCVKYAIVACQAYWEKEAVRPTPVPEPPTKKVIKKK